MIPHPIEEGSVHVREVPFVEEWEGESIALQPGALADTPDTPDGFALFFSLIARNDVTGNPLRLTEHAYKWVEFLYWCYEEGYYSIIEAFRGAGKSVVSTVFVAWRMGQEPTKTNMIIRSAFNAAEDTGATIARIIDKNKNWKLFFPNVVADKETSWSIGKGYNIRDDSVSVGEWAQMLAARGAQKSLMVFPYTSGNIIGRRISGVLLVDDIHDDDNVESPTELMKVIRIWNDTISRTRLPGCWTVFIGTPWDPGDLLQELKAITKYYKFIQTPVMDENGEPTWPELYPEEEIERLQEDDLTGGPGFARMYLLDLSAAMSRMFNFMQVPAETISSMGKARAGLDYASNEGGGNMKWRSHCALANAIYNHFTGDWVIAGGQVGQVAQSVTEQWVTNNQGQYPNLEFTVVEMDGKGAEFYAVLARNPDLRLVPEKTGGKNKQKRIEMLEPLFRSGRLKVSDANTPFLNMLREFLNTYPNINVRHGGWDCMDAVFWAMYHEMQQPIKPKPGTAEPDEKPWWQQLAEM